LVCFAAAIVVGFASGNPTATVTVRAMIVMLIGWCIGRAVGALAQRTVDEQIEAYKKARPIPEVLTPEATGAIPGQEHATSKPEPPADAGVGKV
jgi:hypothetical protein